jgi:hypothetical protein
MANVMHDMAMECNSTVLKKEDDIKKWKKRCCQLSAGFAFAFGALLIVNKVLSLLS